MQIYASFVFFVVNTHRLSAMSVGTVAWFLTLV